METTPSSFIDEPIEVIFEIPPTYEKCPDCPNAFTWHGEMHKIAKVISERQDNERRGRYSNNMKPAHIRMALRNGSWGVGRYCFCVQVEDGRIFEIYYDRAPKNAGDRKGHWFLRGERVIVDEKNDKV